jgi:hypothetical protein
MPNSVALLDNTVQIDRQKSATRRDRIDALLAQYEWKVATSICLLEFKATLLQECITIHDRLRSVGLYTPVVDRLTETQHPQAKLRGHIFRNMINVFAPSSFDVTEDRDRRLAEKARLRLESVIPRLYKWFRSQSVDAVLHDEIECTRALEAPQKKTVAFAVNLPRCRRGENKFCHVEEFIRTRGRPILELLEAVVRETPDGESSQLKRTFELFRSVLEQPGVELSHSDCRRGGDLLIALEGSERATHALSTNARDWAPICEIVGLAFVRVDYPAEAEI